MAKNPWDGLSPNQMARLIAFAQAGDQEIDGAALHAEKNAPWVNGTYSHLLLPNGRLREDPAPYVHQSYPKMLYSAGYLRAAEQHENTKRMRAKRGDDEEREYLIAVTMTARDECTRLVNTPEEHHALGSLWQESPALAREAQEMLELSIAQAAAESAFDDRLMGEQARREREAADEASGGDHLVEVGETPIPTHARKRGRPRNPENV